MSINPVQKLRDRFLSLENKYETMQDELAQLQNQLHATQDNRLQHSLEDRVMSLHNQLHNAAGKIDVQEKRLQYLESELQLQKELNWHMSYYYDNVLAQVEMNRVEALAPGNKARLAELKDKHKGTRCFIIGNGPSLRAEDLDLIQNEVSFGCNRIDKIFGQTNWRPTYFFIADRLLFHNYFDEISAVCKDLPSNTTTLFCSHCLREPESAYDQAIYFALNGMYRKTPEFNPNADQFVYEGGSIAYSEIQFAAYLGFSEIYLVGIDNTILPTKKEGHRELVDYSVEQSHFYKESEQDVAFWNQQFTWLDMAEKHRSGIYDMNVTYNTAKWHCDRLGIKVINATRGGKLEVFPRADLETILSE